MPFQAINPFNEEVAPPYTLNSPQEIDTYLCAAAAQKGRWRAASLTDRAALLFRIAELLEQQIPALAALITTEMGKPIAEAEGELKKSALVCRHYAEHGAGYLKDEPIEGLNVVVRPEPLGVVLGIMPWNFPFWQVFRFLAATLMAGNAVIVKHAPNVPACAEMIAKILGDADAPFGLYHNVRVETDGIQALIADRRIAAVTFTGSTRAGRIVARLAGEAIKPCVMELGGSDPFIVFADCDLEAVAEKAVASRCINGGQSCISAKRFLVEKSVYPRFRDAMRAALDSRRFGDPLDPQTTLGPLARRDLRDGLEAAMASLVAAGATVERIGPSLPSKGWFARPALIEGANPQHPAAQVELFGPAAMLFSFQTEEEAVAIANATRYGLAASVWTPDVARAMRVSEALRSGAVFINQIPASDPRFPFGGVEESGFGRELGREGCLVFTNRKSVVGLP